LRPRASSLTVRFVLGERLRHWWSPPDYRILPLPREYLLPLPIPSRAVSPVFGRLSRPIYPEICPASYGRFRLNNNEHHSGRGYYRGGWHPSYPALTSRAFWAREQPTRSVGTWSSPIVVAHIVEVSRLLRPVGPGFVSQNPSPGDFSQSPYPSSARGSVTPPTT
jgi:hypothetical protein